MSAGELRSLSLEQAVLRYESMDLPLRPATLDPRYVAADASRNAALKPTYLSFEREGDVWLHSLHLADIDDTGLRDASSPYGYGGPVSSSGDPAFLAAAWRAYAQWMTQQRVVVEYLRFHPVLGNEQHYGGTVSDNREVVWMDLRAGDLPASYPARLRHTLRRAERAGLVYREVPLGDQVPEFGAYYREAMAAIDADPFFLFRDAYFEQLASSGFARLGLCRQQDDGASEWLAACLFLDGVGMREYHLAASSERGRAVSAASFALHQGATAAQREGRQRLYLGGGSDTRADNPLLFFKSAFSRERLCYRTGSNVFDAGAYDRLKLRFPAAWAAHPERPIFYRKV